MPDVFYSLNMVGGGADTVCYDCMPKARMELKNTKSLVSVALTHLAAGEMCMWCGKE